MNYKLMDNLAAWMISHGSVQSDKERSDYYCGVRIVEVLWRGQNYTIVQVDGMTCRIDRN